MIGTAKIKGESVSREIAAGAGVKLHNRRVEVYFLSDDKEGDYVLLFKKLDDKRKPFVTEVLLTAEGMEAVVACYIAINEQMKRRWWQRIFPDELFKILPFANIQEVHGLQSKEQDHDQN